MAALSLTLRMDPDQVIERAARQMEGWSSDRKPALSAEWKAMEAAGADLVEMTQDGDTISACLREDFKRLLLKHGVTV